MAASVCRNWKGSNPGRDHGRGRVRRFGAQIVVNQPALVSPSDSGYGSLDDSQPETPPTPRRRFPPPLDGPGSWDESELAAEGTRRRVHRARRSRRSCELLSPTSQPPAG
ncbi:hypothetical protein TOPH_01358 [Tolypocladium ophioglossoides CBS 100239]|uniref:Uncharacterized protein n=1 Tax=Tolypocladium ophioglossoides (strain CBS 100239) TaxID=1163406 RepID=A0A0L0NJU5_TOLOC|nr:hypothetical protein TOPH_01358 [Tolypocladium ophioglossoides CBS 100239]